GRLDERLVSGILGRDDAPSDWQERMRASAVNHVIVYDADRMRLFAALDHLLGDPDQWPLLYLEGDLAVFGWRDPLLRGQGSADAFRGLELDLNGLAFNPTEETRAPRNGPKQEAEVRRWWEALWKPAAQRPIDRDAATLHLLHAEALRRSAPRRHLLAWEASHSAALVGLAGGWYGPGVLFD